MGLSRDIVLLSLFGGIDGFAEGFKRAGYTLREHYYSEIDKYASAVTRYNFKKAIHVGSVTNVRGRDITRPNVITFGSPCQDFSLAGKRRGMEGERSSLISEAIRLITETRPDVFIWENVKGAFSSNNSEDFWAIIQAFANIGGYRLEWQLLNTSWILPQNRERIYLVGHLAEGSSRQVFPIGEEISRSFEGAKQTTNTLTAGGNSGGLHSSMTLVSILDNSHKNEGVREYFDACPTLDARDYKEPRMVKQINQSKESGGKQPYMQNRVFDSDGISPTIDSAAGRWRVRSNTKEGYQEVNQGDSINLSQPKSKTRRGRVGKLKAQTLDTYCNQGVLNGSFIRRLTEIECERLQGFKDDWTKYGDFGDGDIKEISATQR